jgi:hypothetical protein
MMSYSVLYWEEVHDIKMPFHSISVTIYWLIADSARSVSSMTADITMQFISILPAVSRAAIVADESEQQQQQQLRSSYPM